MKLMSKGMVMILVGIILLPCSVGASEDTLFEELQQHFKKDYLSVGLLLQAVGDFQIERSFEGHSGFNISNMRISFSGELDRRYGYFVQANWVSSPSVLDAKLHYRFSAPWKLDVGLFKAPFSQEFLTVASEIDFVNRALVVTAFAPGRQIGAQIEGKIYERRLNWAAGIFNGNRFDGNNNDNNEFLYTTRAALSTPLNGSDTGAMLETGINAAYSYDNNADIGEGLLPNYSGKRIILGADFRLSFPEFLVATEFIYVDLDPRVGADLNPFGFHVTAGYMMTANSQVLFRWDRLDTDDIAATSSTIDLLIFGLNFWQTKATEWQVNYIIDADDAAMDHHQILVNAQVAF